MKRIIRKACRSLEKSRFWETCKVDFVAVTYKDIPVWKYGNEALPDARAVPITQDIMLKIINPSAPAAVIASIMHAMVMQEEALADLGAEALRQYRESALVQQAAINFTKTNNRDELAHALIECCHTYPGSALIDKTGKVISAHGSLEGKVKIDLVLPEQLELNNELSNQKWVAQLCVPLGTADPLWLLLVGTTRGYEFNSFDSQQAATLTNIARAAFDHAETLQQRMALSRYMSGPVAEKVMSENAAALGGSEQQAAVVFADLRNFTELTQEIGARATVRLLNQYYEEMVAIVEEGEGIVDKFVGDGMLAVFGVPFGAPDDAIRATKAGMKMAALAEDLLPTLHPSLQIGIGVCAGTVISGNVGTKKRMDFTVIGNPVNRAAKLQPICKRKQEPLLITERIYGQLPDTLQVRFSPIEEKLADLTVYRKGDY